MTILTPLVCLIASIAVPDGVRDTLSGSVLDSLSGKPLANVTVALQDKAGKILAWAKTDAEGKYALRTDTLSALQLRPSRHRGFLEKVVRGAGQVVTLPVKVVVGAVKQVDPVGMAKAGIISSVTANPAPLTAQVVATVGKIATDQTTSKLRENMAKTLLGERQSTPKEKRSTMVPGEVFLLVVAPGFKDLKDKVGAYWLESTGRGVEAWLETVKLAPTTEAKKVSEVENGAVLLADGKVEPSVAVAGATVTLSVKLLTPTAMPMTAAMVPLKIRIFAREDNKRTVIELKAKEGNPGIFTGTMTLAANLPAGDTRISLLGLRAEPIGVSLKDTKTDPLLAFAQEFDRFDVDRAYEFDLRIMASENRLDLPLTVLAANKTP